MSDLQNQPVDILLDIPDDPIELSQEVLDLEMSLKQNASAPLSLKKYTNEDVYKLVSLVLNYPSGGHGGESFWNLMMKLYGDTLLKGRNGSGLRSRWRKFHKEHPEDCEEQKKQLAATLSPEFIEEVETTIAIGTANASKLAINSKAFATLFPDTSKQKKKSKRKRHGSGLEGKGRELCSRLYVDLELLMPKERKKLKVEDETVEAAKAMKNAELAKNFVIVRNTEKSELAVKDLREVNSGENTHLCTRPDLERSVCFVRAKAVCTPWTELEDTILRYPESSEVHRCLVKLRGEDEVKKRKLALGMP